MFRMAFCLGLQGAFCSEGVLVSKIMLDVNGYISSCKMERRSHGLSGVCCCEYPWAVSLLKDRIESRVARCKAMVEWENQMLDIGL